MHNDKAIYVPSFPVDPALELDPFFAFQPGTRVLPAGFQTRPPFRPLSVDIVLEKDVAVTLRDGVTIYTDILRPAGKDKVPVIVAWSPYGKTQGSSAKRNALFTLLGIDISKLSGLLKFEGPDPAYWCAQGYAVANPDSRGLYHSGGDAAMIGQQEGEDCHDLIEFLAAQDWCNGKVATSGNSYLAFSQWFTAAEKPAHLAAIAPWEGLSDVYRDLVSKGGIPDYAFATSLEINFQGTTRRESLTAEIEKYPLDNDLWATKSAQLEKITVPAYVVASYSNTLHTMGTFRAWRRISSADKWLRIHNNMEWPDFYTESSMEDLRRFFDHYLKGVDNGWEKTPRVRYSVLDLEGNDQVLQPAAAFPPEDVTNTPYYLQGPTRGLAPAKPAQPGTVEYDASTGQGLASFVATFDRETTLVGYPKAKLWVEAKGADDMDLFVLVQKLDRFGTALQSFTVPSHSPLLQDITEHGASILRYTGSSGRLRVSMRQLDPALSTDEVPAHTFNKVEKLSAGEIVPVEIDLLPIGLAFHPGEQLRLVVSSYNPIGGMMPNIPNVVPQNRGRHVIHTGGDFASFLQLPVQAAR